MAASAALRGDGVEIDVIFLGPQGLPPHRAPTPRLPDLEAAMADRGGIDRRALSRLALPDAFAKILLVSKRRRVETVGG